MNNQFEITKEISKEINLAFMSYKKAKDRYTKIYEYCLKKYVPNFEVKYKEATNYVLDVSDDDPFFYIDDIDILEAIQWIAISREGINN